MKGRLPPAILACCCLLLFLNWTWMAPEFLPSPRPLFEYAIPGELPPFGADDRGRPLTSYVTQGAAIVAVPAVLAGLLTTLMGVLGGLLRCMGSSHANTLIQALSEVVGALPRMLVILVVALVMPQDARGLLPLALAWAILASPGAMDEAAAVAGRLGGTTFVEALRAHGYSAWRIYFVHVVAYNLRPVVVRQGAEVMMQVVFLEVALSYLALADNQPSFTHSDSVKSWADLLSLGYSSLVVDIATTHALILGLSLVGLVAVMSLSIGYAARAR